MKVAEETSAFRICTWVYIVFWAGVISAFVKATSAGRKQIRVHLAIKFASRLIKALLAVPVSSTVSD